MKVKKEGVSHLQTQNNMLPKGKVLFIDTTHPILPQKLEKAGFSCDHFPSTSLDELKNLLPTYHGLIIRSKFKIDKELIDLANSLKFIGRVGSGMENINVEYAQSKNIACFNSPEGNRDAVAEHALGMLLSIMNNLNRANQEVRMGIWRREANRGSEIMGKTVGIIGYGNTGSAFAKRLSVFDCHILAYDKYKTGFSSSYVKESNLADIYSHADIVSLHVPLSSETKYMVDEKFISSFHKPVFLINTSRGPVVKTSDLVVALESGKIRSAALDVLEYEATSFEQIYEKDLPGDFNYLINSDKVLLSPHIAGWTFESNIKLSEILADKIIQFGFL
ncbi:MAG: 2-hydroxyacid dehydrogenase [Bacteroidales bacterium]|nr:2-hydroxyacid dehydrogenase [Bacteroidales bacterium]MCF8456693.1 2-hydroxyacid dehydrogenase [Bacteroidales bacterium]